MHIQEALHLYGSGGSLVGQEWDRRTPMACLIRWGSLYLWEMKPEYFLMAYAVSISAHYSFFIANNAETPAEWPTSFNQPVKSGVAHYRNNQE